MVEVPILFERARLGSMQCRKQPLQLLSLKLSVCQFGYLLADLLFSVHDAP